MEARDVPLAVRRCRPMTDRPARQFSDGERRARIAVRHRLCPAAAADSPDAAARAVVALHATEPASVYLSCWARMESVDVGHIDDALYTGRSIVKQLAMRRTLFAFPRDLLPAAWASASARVAGIERARIVKGVQAAGLTDDGDDWLRRARSEVIAALADTPEGRSAVDIRHAVPRIDVKVPLAAGSTSASTAVLTQMGAEADLMRATNLNQWRASRPLWTLTGHWLPDITASGTAAEGYTELVRRWLHRFGPGTLDDLVWWLGSTKSAAREALSTLGAVTVTLERDQTGWLLPDDLDVVADPGPWVALLPTLDPTVMGWKQRDFYLGGYQDRLFDRRGNAGPTAWVDGRVVGCWYQDERNAVRLQLLEPVSGHADRALRAQASRLTAWLDGERIGSSVVVPALGPPAVPEHR